MVNYFWLKNKHTISIFQAQVRDLAKYIEAQPKQHNAYKKNVYLSVSYDYEKIDYQNIERIDLQIYSFCK